MSVYLVRHGDRQDYAHPETWRQQALAARGNVFDPPLSRLGRQQAHETAARLVELLRAAGTPPEDVIILASPFLRTIQTAQPTADALRLPIHIEHGLAESYFHAAAMPKPRHDQQRWLSFPQIDVAYPSLWDARNTPGYEVPPGERESFPADYYRRLAAFAHRLEDALLAPDGALHGKTVVCFSHAASTALVALLLRDHAGLQDYKFAPCGIFHLHLQPRGPLDHQHHQQHHQHAVSGRGDSRHNHPHPLGGAGASDWVLRLRGDRNPHCSENSPTTHPWGFNVERSALFAEMWGRELRALRDAVWSLRTAMPPSAAAPPRGHDGGGGGEGPQSAAPSGARAPHLPSPAAGSPSGGSCIRSNGSSAAGGNGYAHDRELASDGGGAGGDRHRRGADTSGFGAGRMSDGLRRLVRRAEAPPDSQPVSEARAAAAAAASGAAAAVAEREVAEAKPYTLAVLEDRMAAIEEEMHAPGLSNAVAYKLKKDLTRARGAVAAEKRRLAAHRNVGR